MKRGTVLSILLAVASITLVASGLFWAGPFDLVLEGALVVVVGVLFVLSASVLLMSEVFYLGTAVGRLIGKPTWQPAAISLAMIATSGLGLRMTQFNVHLYGAWILFFLATLAVATCGCILILGAMAWGFLAGRQKTNDANQRAG